MNWEGKPRKMSEGTEKGRVLYGNQKTDPRVENPGKVDESIWKKAKEKAASEYGEGRWAAVSYIYKKMGGKFHKKK